MRTTTGEVQAGGETVAEANNALLWPHFPFLYLKKQVSTLSKDILLIFTARYLHKMDKSFPQSSEENLCRLN